MKPTIAPAPVGERLPPVRLVLLTPGSAPVSPSTCVSAADLAGATARLAARLGLPARLLAGADPDAALAALAAEPAGWLASLAEDPGGWQAWGGSWAQVLGAWRQPCLLLLPPPAVGSGLPAAYTALLEHHGVPLVGLLQLDGTWDGPLRAAEGLPWLGRLGSGPGIDAACETIPADEDEDEGLAAIALGRRWSRLIAA